MSDALGWTLEQYVIVRPIASGRFGSVYHATHATSGRSVALKLIPRQGPEGDEKVATERHGAMLQQHFCQAHANLVPEVYEHGPMQGFYAIAMEFVSGQQLSELLKSGPLPPRRAAVIALAICRFLEKAHQFRTTIEGVTYESIVHADLKPDHVLILENDEIRVLDFGIAKALETRSLVTTNKWGSVQYASPERLQSDGRVNRHADFWSAGIMLFEMVAGFRPYRRFEYSLSRLDRAIRTLESPDPLPPASDPALAATIRKLLAPQIERRYSSAVLIAADLAAYLAGNRTVAETEEARAGQETIRVDGVQDHARPASKNPPLPGRNTPSRRGPVAVNAIRRVLAGARRKDTVPPPARDGGPAAPARARGAMGRLKRGARLAAACILVAVGASELVGLMRAERLRDRIAMLEPSDLEPARRQYRAIAGTPLGLGSLSVRRPLADRMVDLADRTILDFRTETPTVTLPEWQVARDCLDLARELAPGDRRIAARHAYVTGHLARIDASTREEADLAVRYFRESARLDPRSPDPYLGLARVAAYVTNDVEALRQAIEAAEARGYAPGRRERAQMGDVHLVLARRARASAAGLTGESRIEHLEQATGGYERCIDAFAGLHYFNSEDNLLFCRRGLEATKQEIERLRPPFRILGIPLFD